MFIPRQIPRASHLTLCTLFAAALTACGGGTTDSGATAAASADTSGHMTALGVSAASANASTTTVATEGNTFTVTGTQTVSFGAGSNWVTKSVTGNGTCSNGFFGSDPAPGTVKSCTVTAAAAASPTPTPATTTLTTEGNTFTVSGTQTVSYGAGSNWIQQAVTGTGSCNNTFFGSDPAPGTAKTCVLASTVATATAPVSAALASEGGTFTVSGTQVVSYGAGSSWIQRSVTGTGTCNNTFFGSDPAFGTVKSCMLATTTAAVPAIPNVTAWVRLAQEGDAIAVTGTQSVRFGDGVNWVTLSVSAATTCSVGAFGSDPAPGTGKFCEIQKTVPGVTQIAGAMPVVNTALLPGAATSFTSARVRTLSAAELAQPNYQTNLSDIGDFREPCSYSHMLFDDPIAYPGKAGASHLHTFMGNDAANASSTASSLASSGGSTCSGGTLNRTAYWTPTIIDTRTGQPVVAISGNYYYKQGYLGVAPGSMKPFPAGLRIIAGNSANTTAIATVAGRFSCLNGGGAWSASIPNCAVGDVIVASVVFPQCWDGVNLDSPDHKSHMAYATGAGCPSDHPIALPEITVNVDYKVTEANLGNYWKLSSDNYDGPGGYSMHADWFGGWDSATNMAWLTNCVNKQTDCHDQLLGDGRILY